MSRRRPRASQPANANAVGALLLALLAIAGSVGAANQPPSLSRLDGTRWSVAQGGELYIRLSDYLVDPDDALANFTFAVAWDNGAVVSADVTNGTLVIRSVGAIAGHAQVTVVATDSAGQPASATIGVDAGGAPISAAGLAVLLTVIFALIGVGAWLFTSYRRGKRRESTESSTSNQDKGTSEELEDREREEQVVRAQLPPVTVLRPQGAAVASSLLLLYRDGRPIAWIATATPSPAEAERAQALAPMLAERALRTRPGEALEGETVSFGGRRIVLEGRSQLFLGAVIEAGADEPALRARMRVALDRVFDANADTLQRWNGSAAQFKGLEDALGKILRP